MFVPPLIQKIEPGDVIGRCRLIRELGRGGVGTVYLASHQTLQIEVALKILSPALSLDNPALAERFVREAQLAARIRHPNVIAVMDAAQDEATGLYYIVMEYVGGGSLSWHLRHGPLPEAKALEVVIGIAHALTLAEESRIVHRDIKPDNIMLDLRGTSKLADLGLAKHEIDSHTSITLGGSFMGTPAYMSPDQARDAKVADTRDDIYSLGATFYECLTGQAPFQGETPYNIMSELLTKPSPRPRALRPEISRSADLICRKMMAKTRSLRYSNSRALLSDLQICRTLGDKGFDQLDAASFDHDAIQAHEQAVSLGVETSADGVAVIPEPPGDSGPISKSVPGLAVRRTDPTVFGAAAALIALVMVAVVLLAWSEPRHPFAFLRTEFAKLSGGTVVQPQASAPAPVVVQPTPIEPTPVAAPVKPVPVVPTPPTTGQVAVNPTPPIVEPTPVVPPGNNDTNGAPIEAIPAMPAVPDSAFEARAIAEGSLSPNLIGTNLHAPLVMVVGKRDDTPDMMPATWKFYFYDKAATGHARIVSVKGRKVVKTGEDIGDALAPYRDQNILPEEKPLTDSAQALQTAEALLPSGMMASSSEFVLVQKDSVPVWKVTLWAKDPKGEEQELGVVTILADKDVVSGNTLKPDRAK